jgi:predicted choloylglycine hydrolase
MKRLPVTAVAFALILTSVGGARAETFRYKEGKYGKAELKYINGLPVLVVEGTPEQIGEQTGALTGTQTKRLLSFPKEYLEKFGYESAWPALVRVGKSMAPSFPADHLKELEAAAKKAGVDRDMAVVGNAFPDIKKFGGCSTLVVDGAHSSTGGPLFGRNLDYPTLGFLHEYSLVTVFRPTGKHSFASIGFPGFLGCLSGMNDAGLAVAVLEVYASNDDSLSFDPKGVPYGLVYRRILEECTTVDEAEKLLRSVKRTTRNNLAVCDRKGGVVFEITPKSVRVRPAEDGLCPCTNHFRTKELATDTICRRYKTLEKSKTLGKLDVPQMMKLLDEVNQGDRTFQSMVFEPKALKLHLSIGKLPASSEKPKLLELEPLFKK